MPEVYVRVQYKSGEKLYVSQLGDDDTLEDFRARKEAEGFVAVVTDLDDFRQDVAEEMAAEAAVLGPVESGEAREKQLDCDYDLLYPDENYPDT